MIKCFSGKGQKSLNKSALWTPNANTESHCEETDIQIKVHPTKSRPITLQKCKSRSKKDKNRELPVVQGGQDSMLPMLRGPDIIPWSGAGIPHAATKSQGSQIFFKKENLICHPEPGGKYIPIVHYRKTMNMDQLTYSVNVPFLLSLYLFLWFYKRTSLCLENKHVGQNALDFYTNFWSTQKTNEYNTSNLQLNGPEKKKKKSSECVWRKGVDWSKQGQMETTELKASSLILSSSSCET